MKILGLIPARYGSTRLPGKALEVIGGKTMIQRVYEQASKLGEVGAGLHMSPNAIHVIRELGLRPALEPYDFRPRALKTRHFQSGEASFVLPFDEDFENQFGTPFIDVHRADLHRVLADAVSKAGLSAEVIDSIEQQPPSPVPNTACQSQSAQIELRGIPLSGFVAVIRSLITDIDGWHVTTIDLKPAVSDGAVDQTWDTMVTLTRLVYSP